MDGTKANGSEPPRKIKFQTLAEFVRNPETSTHVRGIVPAGAIVLVFGPPKGGKTFSVCDLAMHAAHGMDWQGCAIKKRMKVAYLVGEGRDGFKVRLQAWLEHHDSIETQGDFVVLPEILSLPDEVHDLVEVLRDFRPDIMVTDTLNAYFGAGDENSTKDMSAFCDAVRCLRDELGSSVVVIHHTGHADATRERGSIVLRACADVLIQVAKDENEGKLVGFQVIAARDMEPMESPIALKLVPHETTWQDPDGVPRMSCIVQAADRPVTLPGRGARPLGRAQTIVFQSAQEIAKGKTTGADGEIIIARHEVVALAQRQGVSKQSISSAWKPLDSLRLSG